MFCWYFQFSSVQTPTIAQPTSQGSAVQPLTDPNSIPIQKEEELLATQDPTQLKIPIETHVFHQYPHDSVSDPTTMLIQDYLLTHQSLQLQA